MNLNEAKEIADRLIEQLRPYCERSEIAGSIRRNKYEVKDIEIVVIPIVTPLLNLFGDTVGTYDELNARMVELQLQGDIVKLKGGERYQQYRLPEDIKLDLFIVRPPAQWGVIFALRTGPADFSRRLVTCQWHGGLLPPGMRVRNGGLYAGDHLLITPEEEDFFTAIGLPEWIPPPHLRGPVDLSLHWSNAR